MPPFWRRLICRFLGHRYVQAGVEGLLDFRCCCVCGRIEVEVQAQTEAG